MLPLPVQRRLSISFLTVLSMGIAGCGYGPKVQNGNIEVYYTDGATKEEADRVAAHYVKQVGAAGGTRSFQVKKAIEGYQLRMVVRKEARTDANMTPAFELDAARCSRDVFDGVPVEFHICDERLNTITVLPPRADLRFGVLSNKVEVFFASANDRPDAERLAKSLFEDFNIKNGVTAKLVRRDKTVEFHMVFDTALANDQAVLAGLKNDGALMSRKLFAGAPVEIHLCDDRLRVIKVLTP